MELVRKFTQVFSVVAIIILLPLTLLGVWAQEQIYDEEAYIRSVQ